MTDSLPALQDRWCRPGGLDNPLRRWLAPARKELRPLDIDAGQTVADLGTGVGYFSADLSRVVGPGGKMWGVDEDPENLAIAQARLPDSPRIRWLVSSASHLSSIPSDSVDRVLLYLVLCCLVDKRGAMSEAWRILRPGGLALVTFPRWRAVPPTLRRRPLRVTPMAWGELLAQRPWKERDAPRGRIISRHLLEKPEAPEGGPIP